MPITIMFSVFEFVAISGYILSINGMGAVSKGRNSSHWA